MLSYPPYLDFPLLNIGVDVRNNVLHFSNDFALGVADTVEEMMIRGLGSCPCTKQFIGYIVQSGITQAMEKGKQYCSGLLTNIGTLDYVLLYKPNMLHADELLDGPTFVVYITHPRTERDHFYAGWYFQYIKYDDVSWYVARTQEHNGKVTMQRVINQLDTSHMSPFEVLTNSIPGVRNVAPHSLGGEYAIQSL